MSELKANEPRTCPECGGQNLYQTTTAAAGLYGPNLLPCLSGFLRYAKLRVITCAGCGLTRFYASDEAREKLASANGWSRL